VKSSDDGDNDDKVKDDEDNDDGDSDGGHYGGRTTTARYDKHDRGTPAERPLRQRCDEGQLYCTGREARTSLSQETDPN
jgi:hypothetical protein